MYKRNAGLSAKYERFNYKYNLVCIESEVLPKPTLRLYSPLCVIIAKINSINIFYINKNITN